MAGLAGDDPFEDDSDGDEFCYDPFDDDGEGEGDELCYGPFVDYGEGDEFYGAPFDDDGDGVGFCVSGFSYPGGSDTLESLETHEDPLPQTLVRSSDSDGDLGIVLPQLVSALNLADDTSEEEEAAGFDGGGEGFMLSGFDLEPPPVTDGFLGGLRIVMGTDEVEEEEEAAGGDRSGEGLMPSGFDLGPPPIMRGFVGGFRMLVGADDTDSDSDDADFVDVLAGQVGESESRARPLPASRAAVDGLPEATLSEEEASRGCAVCKDSFEQGQRVVWLPCKHYFHGDCIRPWLAIRNTCPVCRYQLPTDGAEYAQR